MILNRIGIFLRLKVEEIGDFIKFIFTNKELSPFRWGYLICHAVGFITLICMNNGWEWPYWAIEFLNLSKEVGEPSSSIEPTVSAGIAWYTIVFAFVVGIIWGIFEWLNSNWKEAGKIHDERNKK